MEDRICSGERQLSKSDLQAHAARVAAGYSSLGVEENASVGIMLRNDLAYFEAMMGARLSGATAVPVNWHLSGEEVNFILRDADVRVLLVHADLLAMVEAHIPDDVEVLVAATPPEVAAAYRIAPDRCRVPAGRLEWHAWLQAFEPIDRPAERPGGPMLYTSGTTGRPKGVRRASMSNDALLTFHHASARTFGIREGMRAVATGPLHHSAPNAYANIGVRLGCYLRLMPCFDAEALLRLIESERLTHMHMVPTMFVRLLRLAEDIRNRYDLSSLESVVHGAAPCPNDIKRRMIEWWGPVIREYYGSTEASMTTAATSEEWLERPGTVGRAVSGARVEIHDERGRVQAPGEVGEIYVRLSMAPEFTYHKRDDDRRAVERDGLVTNGDVGYLDEDGYLFICDRKRDMIISGGVNIYPAEIEAVLLGHPGVRDCGVFGIPHHEYGETIAAAIEKEPRAALDEETVRRYLSEHLARFKVPSVVTFHDALPREDNGKIYKRRLRAPYWRDAGRNI